MKYENLSQNYKNDQLILFISLLYKYIADKRLGLILG